MPIAKSTSKGIEIRMTGTDLGTPRKVVGKEKVLELLEEPVDFVAMTTEERIAKLRAELGPKEPTEAPHSNLNRGAYSPEGPVLRKPPAGYKWATSGPELWTGP